MIEFLSMYWGYVLLGLAGIGFVAFLFKKKRFDLIEDIVVEAVKAAEKYFTKNKQGKEKLQYAVHYIREKAPFLKFFFSEQDMVDFVERVLKELKERGELIDPNS